MGYYAINNLRKDKYMMYLILEETRYQHNDTTYCVVAQTTDPDKAVDMLQGYKLINKRKDRFYSIMKYEPAQLNESSSN